MQIKSLEGYAMIVMTFWWMTLPGFVGKANAAPAGSGWVELKNRTMHLTAR